MGARPALQDSAWQPSPASSCSAARKRVAAMLTQHAAFTEVAAPQRTSTASRQSRERRMLIQHTSRGEHARALRKRTGGAAPAGFQYLRRRPRECANVACAPIYPNPMAAGAGRAPAGGSLCGSRAAAGARAPTCSTWPSNRRRSTSFSATCRRAAPALSSRAPGRTARPQPFARTGSASSALGCSCHAHWAAFINNVAGPDLF